MKKVSLCLAAAVSCISGFAQPKDGKPNIIFFLVDDMGWQETSVPFWKEKTMLNDRYHTPNMEILASEGMKFTQAYACPLSSPTRVSLMTGMNAARHGVTNWTLRKNISPDQNHKILEIPSWNVNGISPYPGLESTKYVKTLPMFLKEAGYTTIHVGKAHWGAKDTPGGDPRRLGFDVNIAGHAGGGPGSYYGKYNFSDGWRTNPPDLIWDVPGLEKYHGKDINITEALTIEAMNEMEKAVTRGTPFYLYMAQYAVHAPWEKDDRFYQRYIDMGLNDFEATLASMIESMDKSLGDLMTKVKQLGIENNTVIIFMSDNGSPSQCPQNHPLRGHKIDPYEGGIRDPMLVKWPGVVKEGTVCNEPLIIEDFFPSILEIAGVKKYKQPGGKIDGISFVPLLLEKKVNSDKRSFFWHFPHYYGSEPYSVIREGNWKLIYWYLDGKTELYNIPDDISESRDLSASNPEITERLAKKLGNYLKSVGAKTPIDKATKIARPFPGDPWVKIATVGSIESTSQSTNDAAFQLNLDAPIDKWDEAIPLGNGLTGGLLWGKENIINLSLDRGDLWDLRPHPAYNVPGLTYETIKRMALAGLADSLNKQYANPNDYPTKMPGCRLVITLPDSIKAESFQLDMKRGLGTVDLGDKNIKCFFSAVKPVALMEIPGSVHDLELVANQAVTNLGNEPAHIEKDENGTCLIQDAALGFRYVFCVQKKQLKDYTLIALSAVTNRDTDDPIGLARRQTTEALGTGYESLFEEHAKWWNDFWSRSSVNIPDTMIQKHYNLVQYFYGAASRKGAPPMPLQGVWTADAGSLPPWHGDYHNDLNTQLTYWAYLASNHFDQGESFLDLMWSLKPVHEEFARAFFGTEGLVVPGVMSLDGKPMGIWYQYSLSPTMGAWVAQSFYWHWRYTMDPQFLKERAYPYCAGIADALVGLMRPDASGRLKLPLSSSPEIHNNTQQAWLKPNSNFDLALIRWILGANAEMAKALDLNDSAIRWKSLLAKMDDLAVDGEDGTLLVSQSEPLKESHRHFSHLMAIYPLGTLNIEGTSRDRRIIDASLEQIDQFGSKFWCGYSFSWMACMLARAGEADRALKSLNDYLDCTLRNGFHVNGAPKRKELTDYSNMRAFTLEGNFAAAQAVHEMLLQSWGNLIRIFPAIPEEWKDVSFNQLRAEGGFIVSAQRKSGITDHVTITATVDQPLHIRNPFGQHEYESDVRLEKNGNNQLSCYLKKGQTLHLTIKEKM